MKTKGDFRRAHQRRGAMNPQDGEVREVVVDFANGVAWMFKYREGSPSKYRWEFIGGASLEAIDDTILTLTNSTFWNNNGPQITLPFSGEYKAYMWAEAGATAALTATLGLNIAGAALINGASKVMVTGSPNSQDMSYLHPYTEFAGGTILNVGYESTNASGNLVFAGRRLDIIPRRVTF